MELFLELLLAELVAIAIRYALVRLLAWIRVPSGPPARPEVLAAA